MVLVMPSTINMKVATLSSVGSNSLGFWKFPSFDRGETYTTTVYYVSFRTSSAGVIEIYVCFLQVKAPEGVIHRGRKHPPRSD